MSSLIRRRNLPLWLLAAGVLALGVLLAMRGWNLYPAVFADEYTYNRFSRYVPLRDAEIPDYLYFWVMSWTKACGTGFLTCVRLTNIAFYLASAPFIYNAARLVASPRWAAFVAIVALALPFNSYVDYFMPEAMFFFGFWVVVAAVLAQRTARPWIWGIIGVLTGLLMLVKPHALFSVPAIAVFPFLLGGDRGARTGSALGFLLATFAIRYGVAWLIAGAGGLAFFGSQYGGQFDSHYEPEGLGDLLRWAVMGAVVHAAVVVSLFSLPVGSALGSIWNAWRLRDSAAIDVRLAVLAALLIGSNIGSTALFSTFVGEYSPETGIFRFHERYYEFTFPLLLLVALGAIARPVPRWYVPICIAALLIAVAGWSAGIVVCD
jgi:phosphoglycerol transferase